MYQFYDDLVNLRIYNYETQKISEATDKEHVQIQGAGLEPVNGTYADGGGELSFQVNLYPY